MSPKQDDLKMLISKFRTMNIEELKASIDHWEENTDCSNQLPSLDIAIKELELKYKERQEQIKLLTKSLISSSRFSRWITSLKSVFRYFTKHQNL